MRHGDRRSPALQLARNGADFPRGSQSRQPVPQGSDRQTVVRSVNHPVVGDIDLTLEDVPTRLAGAEISLRLMVFPKHFFGHHSGRSSALRLSRTRAAREALQPVRCFSRGVKDEITPFVLAAPILSFEDMPGTVPSGEDISKALLRGPTLATEASFCEEKYRHTPRRPGQSLQARPQAAEGRIAAHQCLEFVGTRGKQKHATMHVLLVVGHDEPREGFALLEDVAQHRCPGVHLRVCYQHPGAIDMGPLRHFTRSPLQSNLPKRYARSQVRRGNIAKVL